MPTDRDLLAVWLQCLPDQPDRGEAVIARYAEPHRRYHDTAHLASVLGWVDALADHRHDLFFVRLAAFYHDAVYAVPPGQVSNEEASARLALRELTRVGLEQEELSQVARLVRLTETHVPDPATPTASCSATPIWRCSPAPRRVRGLRRRGRAGVRGAAPRAVRRRPAAGPVRFAWPRPVPHRQGP